MAALVGKNVAGFNRTARYSTFCASSAGQTENPRHNPPPKTRSQIRSAAGFRVGGCLAEIITRFLGVNGFKCSELRCLHDAFPCSILGLPVVKFNVLCNLFTGVVLVTRSKPSVSLRSSFALPVPSMGPSVPDDTLALTRRWLGLGILRILVALMPYYATYPLSLLALFSGGPDSGT